jgi:hypothetical protein
MKIPHLYTLPLLLVCCFAGPGLAQAPASMPTPRIKGVAMEVHVLTDDIVLDTEVNGIAITGSASIFGKVSEALTTTSAISGFVIRGDNKVVLRARSRTPASRFTVIVRYVTEGNVRLPELVKATETALSPSGEATITFNLPEAPSTTLPWDAAADPITDADRAAIKDVTLKYLKAGAAKERRNELEKLAQFYNDREAAWLTDEQKADRAERIRKIEARTPAITETTIPDPATWKLTQTPGKNLVVVTADDKPLLIGKREGGETRRWSLQVCKVDGVWTFVH